MAYTCVHNGVVFIEGSHPEANGVSNVASDLSFKFGAQLKNLNHVKDDLVNKTLANNCNCVINFTYGQKSRWLAIDDVAYWGKGVCAVLPPEVYQDICAACAPK